MTEKISIGNDIVHIPRFSKSMEKNAFVEKVFHPEEIDACEKKPNRIPSYAARFAAKEAFAKAIGTGLYAQGITPQDVWVQNQDSGKPYLCFSEKLTNILKEKNVCGCDVSLSHHGDYALAHVILY